MDSFRYANNPPPSSAPLVTVPSTADEESDCDLLRPTCSSAPAGAEDTPELSMVLEKALVLLTAPEFGRLNDLLDAYRSSAASVDDFAAALMAMLAGGQKVKTSKCVSL